MWIKSLELNKFRNYLYQKIEFNENINIFLGDNAQGKTNLLESIFYLANAKSFKANRDRELIMFSEKEMVLDGVIRKGKSFKNVYIKANESSKDIFVNDIKYDKTSDLKSLFKIVLFTPEDLTIIKDGPNFRRKLIDDIIISVDFSYKGIKRDFDKVLLNRNKILKNQKSKFFKNQLLAYDEQIIRLNYKIYQYRKKYIALIDKYANKKHELLTYGREDLHIVYKPDIKADSLDEYKSKFKQRLIDDLKYFRTSSGSQRDEIDIIINGKDTKKYGSQGQQRSAILNIKLANVSLIENTSQDKAIILFDDVFSELDEKRSSFLLENLGRFQTIITATNTKSLDIVDRSKIRKIKDGHILK
ncbi:DNA replication/repair protein RecF [Anaerococcus porci]|uniref:DNA replication and repair protein RecF n=1 Tax=Anaerococcus porci TaxID=2652269 RepID=A0A6N7VU50_9FIRM|nr:DNA replication/repair protein RecF [Anaerococcus porci]MDY3005852.1 DNA replication/repair protein RecF [Anaerococcus porci]MSS77593.1 DNA replication/repair protein RecF [Anaerococcus porci]